ncbi:HAMP domain-containing histidine kinase [Candidatus Sumerlaeota bacterium]|nr:HAMP domain-containing histidine kinase [Candidatus Sumerlaeota bacterium]
MIWMHGAALIAVSTAIYLGALIFTLRALERQYYIPEKVTIIKDLISRQLYFDQASVNSLNNNARTWLSMRGALKPPLVSENQQKAVQRMEETVRADLFKFFAKSPNVIRVSIDDADSNHIMLEENLERLRLQNNFSNSILVGDFSTQVQQSYADQYESRVFGYMRISVTSPLNNPAVERLTTKYRLMMVGTFVLYTLIYIALLLLVIRPLTLVLTYMQSRDPNSTSIIRRPRTILERAYNDLARDAALTRVSKELRDRIATSGTSLADPILQEVPHLLMAFGSIADPQIWIFGRKMGQSGWHFEKVFSGSTGADEDRPEVQVALTAALNADDPLKSPEKWNARPLESAGTLCAQVLQQSQDRMILFVAGTIPSSPALNEWWLDVYHRLTTELRYALDSIEGQRRLILQEKSKANISLSRNLGHDLTNIIATGKLELMTINAFLSLSPADVNASPAKQEIFRESLQALLNNMRFLQEIVNLYRSFSYLQKPRFEDVDISELVADVADLFRLSIPRNISIQKSMAKGMTTARVEPRLLRLALFNILQNAYEAIKRASRADSPQGVITVSTRINESIQRLEISVDDSGDGIRDEQGKLLREDRLPEIFRLGFSTKENQEGEGLGLNWVQTIVREFHGGELVAQNHSNGGARFTIRLPILTGEQGAVRSDMTPTQHHPEKA